MINSGFCNAKNYAGDYPVKRVFFTLLLSISIAINTSLVFGLDPNPVQKDVAEFSKMLEKTRVDLQGVKTQTALVAPISHELHAYFEESIGIIERCLNYVELDLSKGESVAARIGLSEADFMTTFLKEELDLAANQATVVYREIDVTQHGLKSDGVTDNMEPLANLLASLKDYNEPLKLLFPEGKYFIKPQGAAFRLENLEDIVFQGIGNATLLFDGHVITRNLMRVDNCRNLEFRNLSIDIEPLLCTLGKIVSVESGNQFILDVREDYPLPDSSWWTASILRGLVRDPGTEIMIRDLGDPRVIELEDLGDRKFRLTLDDNALSGNPNMTSGFSAGQLFSLHPRGRPEAGSAVEISNGRHLLFSHFNIYAGDAHLVFIRRSAGVKFLDCDIIPREGRAIMNNADGIHCQSNNKGIYLERCRVMKMNDDCMNFYSKLTSILDKEGDSKFTLLTSGNPDPDLCSDFCVGDNIAFLNANTGEFDGITSVKSIKAVSLGDQRDLLQIETTDPVPNILSRRSVGRPDRGSGREYTPSGGDVYRRAMAIDAPFEHMAMNLGHKSDGFIIRNCEFGYNRATGFKCKATNGVVRNTIFHDQGSVFKIGLDWLEGTWPSKIEMTDVTIDRGLEYFGGLPGKEKGLPAKEAVRYMKYVNFKNVIDGSGNAIPAPDDIK